MEQKTFCFGLCLPACEAASVAALLLLCFQLWVLRAFLPAMVKSDRGSVVSICALAGYGGFPNMLPFVASKFAMRGVMEGLYLELRQVLCRSGREEAGARTN